MLLCFLQSPKIFGLLQWNKGKIWITSNVRGLRNPGGGKFHLPIFNFVQFHISAVVFSSFVKKVLEFQLLAICSIISEFPLVSRIRCDFLTCSSYLVQNCISIKKNKTSIKMFMKYRWEVSIMEYCLMSMEMFAGEQQERTWKNWPREK